MFIKILLLAISSLFACCATSAEIKALSAEPNFGRYDSKQAKTKASTCRFRAGSIGQSKFAIYLP